MPIHPTYHVLVIGEDPVVLDRIATFLSTRRFEVFTCPGLAHARDVLVHWTPHILVFVPSCEAERHAELETLRHKYPSLPVVVLTAGDGPDLLLDLEAFAPALPVKPSLDLAPIASAVSAATTFC
jgi:DNA-binding NarL/FixJ family response regulator